MWRRFNKLVRSSGHCRRRNRELHTLYVHQTVAGADDHTAKAIAVGLFGALRAISSDVGYFAPIGCRTDSSEFVKDFFRLDDELSIMQGIDQSQALEFIASGNLDDLLEPIYVAFEELKRRHECVLIEGTRLTDSLNARIASVLGSPVLLAADGEAAFILQPWREDGVVQYQEWAAEMAAHARSCTLGFEKLKVAVAGAFVYGAPDAPECEGVLRDHFSKWKLPFLGKLPRLGSPPSIESAEELFSMYLDIQAALKDNYSPSSPLLFKNSLFWKTRGKHRVILLPEGSEPRTVQAAGFILKHNICSLVLLGNPEKVLEVAKLYEVDLSSAVIRDISVSEELEKYVSVYYQARKHKGMTLEAARQALRDDPIILGTCMVSAGDADGMVCGAIHTTANTVRPALQIIKTDPDTPIVSSAMFICLEDAVLVYADVAINTNPTPEELAIIAIATADTASAFGLEARVAMLSYATGDSNAGPLVQKISEAVLIARTKRPDLSIEGPFQYDAAVNPVAAKIKLKGKPSEVAGRANVFIFPDLNASNIACKAVQQHTGATVIGPILQGLRKPVNDLSRGCTVKDIIATIATTALQAERNKRDALAYGVDAMV